MNKNSLIKKLENLDIPQVELPSHQRRLKLVLLNSGDFKKQITMSTFLKKFTLPVGAIALLFFITFGMISLIGQPSQVSAKEIAKKSYENVINLSSDQQETLIHTVGMDSRTVLQEALSAEDLKVLTYDELDIQGNFPPDPDGVLHTLKFLQFTRTDGMKVILGIDENNMPVFGSAASSINSDSSVDESGEKIFNTRTEDGKGLVNCTIENGVEKCAEANE